MDQTTRDYTYRLDALRAICEPSDWKGEECAQAADMWMQQHNANKFMESMEPIFVLGILTLIVMFFIPYLFYLVMVRKIVKKKRE